MQERSSPLVLAVLALPTLSWALHALSGAASCKRWVSSATNMEAASPVQRSHKEGIRAGSQVLFAEIIVTSHSQIIQHIVSLKLYYLCARSNDNGNA